MDVLARARFDGAAWAVGERRHLGPHRLHRDGLAHIDALNRHVDAREGIAVGIGALAPTVIVIGHVQRIGGVADKVGPHAQVFDGLLLTAQAVRRQPRPVRGIGRQLLAGAVGPPIGQVFHQLLPAVDDLIGQPARLPAVGPCRPQGCLELGAGGRQGRQERPAQHLALVIAVDEVGRITAGIVQVPGLARAVRLARQLADIARRLRRAQEGRQGGGQRLGRQLADHPMPRIAPGEGLTDPSERKNNSRGGGQAQTLGHVGQASEQQGRSRF